MANKKKTSLYQITSIYTLHEKRSMNSVRTTSRRPFHVINCNNKKTIFIGNQDLDLLRNEIKREVQSLREKFGEF